jgi:hypothetical protein
MDLAAGWRDKIFDYFAEQQTGKTIIVQIRRTAMHFVPAKILKIERVK